MPHFERLLQALNEPVFEMDVDGRVTYASPAVQTWTGRPLQTDAPYKFSDALDSKQANRFEQTFKRLVTGKALDASVALKWTLADGGEAVPVEIRLAAIVGENSKITGVAGWLRDTSAETAAEAAANLQSTHLLDLVENIHDACVIEAADGSVEMVNAAFCELFEIRAASQSLVGTGCAALFAEGAKIVTKRTGPLYVPLDVPLDITDESALDDDGAESATEFHFSTARYDIIQKTLAAESDGGVTGRVHVFRATAIDDASTQSAPANANLIDGALVERITTDLAATIEGAQRALDEAEQLDWPESVVAHLRRVESSAQSAFATVVGMVEPSHLESSREPIVAAEPREFLLREQLAELFDKLVPVAEANRIALNLRVEQDVPSLLIGDAALLIRALQQLMGCAIEAGDADDKADDDIANKTIVDLTIHPEYSADALIHLSFTVHQMETRPAGGTAKTRVLSTRSAMQLSLARQGARALAVAGGDKSGGAIDFKKTKDGAAYHFTVPFAFRDTKPPRPRPQLLTLTGAAVLIVSSQAEERKHLADLARAWRMQPREADNAAMALYLLGRMVDEGNPIPLVITSNDLPVQDGFLLAFRIKHQPRLKDTIVMMIAQSGKPGDAIHCRENGISAYLRHPMRADQLRDAITAVMGATQDSEATHTLITRHSLREAHTGTVLIVDADREQTKTAATILRKRDFRVVVAESAEDALAALLQDVFDAVILDVATPGFDSIAAAPALLRAQLGKDRKVAIIAALNDFEKVSGVHYQGVITKPYEKDALLEKLADVMGSDATASRV